MLNDTDMDHLRRCIALAEAALEAGDEPFGSVLVSADGKVLLEARNRANSVDRTRHPEFEIARWAGGNLSAEESRRATVYTSGEHCPMCAAAHGLVGLGRIVYASSSEQLTEWLCELGVNKRAAIRSLPVGDIVPNAFVEGPVPELAERVHALHRRLHSRPK